MKHILALFLLFVLGLAGGLAEPIGPFPGLEKIIRESDAILLIRIEEKKLLGVDTWCTYKCLVHSSLKGDFYPVTGAELRLFGAAVRFPNQLYPGMDYLVFLKTPDPKHPGGAYSSLTYRGSILRLSPFGIGKKKEGTVKEQIEHIIKVSQDFWRVEQEHEDALFNLVLGKPNSDRQPGSNGKSGR
ncbi:MAG: hypothetical protein HY300_12855 [Verrucomicrobia bacterium]|nr:hypothetical protein [Verrucomicrobiota bacterium]